MKKEYRLRIEHDDDADSPRDRRHQDNLGTFLCWHKRHNLGDDNPIKHADFSSWEAIEAHLREEYEAHVVLPVYMRDHGGITLSTSPFTCPWDSGRVGFIFASRSAADKWFGEEQVSDERIAAALDAEVKTYSQWLEGDMWGYVVEEVKNCPTCGHIEHDHVDSCWGFYGEKAAREAGEESLSYQRRENAKEE